MRLFFRLSGLAAVLSASLLTSLTSGGELPQVAAPAEPSFAERLAAHEVRRYLYLRTATLPRIVPLEHLSTTPAIVVARKDHLTPDTWNIALRLAIASLGPESYLIKTIKPHNSDSAPTIYIIGNDDTGVLYGAYRFAECLGVRFYLHGDVIPDEPMTWATPDLNEQGKPLFAIRGIQPFHDFPEGPDWWNRQDYLAILGQLPKMRLNFFALHTYPEGHPNAEPTVWIGLPQDIGEGTSVRHSYVSSYQNTRRGNWGYQAMRTSDFICGSAQLFEADAFGADVKQGLMPAPVTPEDCDALFARSGKLLQKAFGFARQLGIKTCIGTETPLIIPAAVQTRLKALGKDPADPATIRELYEGMFRRIAQVHPLDYYWFWTPEGWTWQGNNRTQVSATTNDLFQAIAARENTKAPFQLATCGWVLGPQEDRALFDKILPPDFAVSCINREVGKTPVEPGFADVRNRSKWAIPWLEDDPNLAAPQLWVGRMRRDAADALRYGCDGLLGIHWRTRVLSMNVGALAQAAWTQEPWIHTYEPPPLVDPKAIGAIGGHVANFPGHPIAGTELDTVYQTVRYDMSAYRIPVSNQVCTVTLHFCEPHYDAAGKRVFSVDIQGRQMIRDLDIFARAGKDRALDLTFTNIYVRDGRLNIDFIRKVEYPSIAGISIVGTNTTLRINCGGGALGDFVADLAGPTQTQVYANAADYYRDWATHEFGADVGQAAADIFTRVDCKLPMPTTWVDGPGGIRPDPRPWAEVEPEYAFVGQFAALRPTVSGPGNLERYDYWLETFRYLKTVAEVNCAWAAYNRVREKVVAEKDPDARKNLARIEALPAREILVKLVEKLFNHLLATVSTTGELGTVANWNQHNLPGLLIKPGEELRSWLGEDLPGSARPAMHYSGSPRLIVPTKRTTLASAEPFELKVILLGQQPARTARLHWRELGAGKYRQESLFAAGRGVYSATLPNPGRDFEYYVEVLPENGKALWFPPTAPRLNQTVIVTP